MAAVLQGDNTATQSITNTMALKIQLADDETLFYQFLDVADKKAYDICQTTVQYIYNPDSDEEEMGFYLANDTKEETPYFISEFVRDNYPAIG